MQLLVLFCLVAGSLAQIDFNVRDCPANSHYTTCGTACPLTCENYLSPPQVCVLMCKIGCECDEGYVLAKDGSCVLPEHCPPQAVEKSCSGEAETGLCRAYFPSWYFDTKSGTCKRFVYGGCGGNGNRYATEEECLQTCAGQRALDRPDCVKKAAPGNCLAYMPRFYYDQEEGMCKKFIYGGCGGNRNNFATEDECYNKCGALVAPKVELCEQEKETGLCRGYFPRYYYNKQTGECEKFIYGGCGGNDNNFSSKDNCEQVCKA
uniref:Putative serine proteinase inhibitor n=1 Tax=Parasteatoda tepidariorum TaxID=114398 RepID=A0A2L2XZH5_PARTP